MECNHDIIINNLANQGSLFRVAKDPVTSPPALIKLEVGDGDVESWDGLDYGPAAVVTEIDDWVGNSHEWTLSEPITSAKELNRCVRSVPCTGATVYQVTREYGGPEEGGWWYDVYHPLACVLADRSDPEADKAYDGAMAWVLLDHEGDLKDGRIVVRREAVIGVHTTVGRLRYS